MIDPDGELEVYTLGRCRFEAGVVGDLADNECSHGRLRGDRTAPCGCWPGEARPVLAKLAPTPDLIGVFDKEPEKVAA